MPIRYRFLILAVLLATGCAKKKQQVEVYETNEPPPAAAGDTLGTERVQTPETTGFGTTGPTGADTGAEASSPLADIYFEFDSYELLPAARQTLRLNAAWLRSRPETQVLIEGHCDERGTEEYNLALGDRRAQAAHRYLVDLGVPAQGLATISYGEARPVVTGAGEQAWAKNRRVHFRILEREGAR